MTAPIPRPTVPPIRPEALGFDFGVTPFPFPPAFLERPAGLNFQVPATASGLFDPTTWEQNPIPPPQPKPYGAYVITAGGGAIGQLLSVPSTYGGPWAGKDRWRWFTTGPAWPNTFVLGPTTGFAAPPPATWPETVYASSVFAAATPPQQADAAATDTVWELTLPGGPAGSPHGFVVKSPASLRWLVRQGCVAANGLLKGGSYGFAVSPVRVFSTLGPWHHALDT